MIRTQWYSEAQGNLGVAGRKEKQKAMPKQIDIKNLIVILNQSGWVVAFEEGNQTNSTYLFSPNGQPSVSSYASLQI